MHTEQAPVFALPKVARHQRRGDVEFEAGANDHQALEQLCRTITRPALANERVQTNAAGQVVLKLKTAWRDGTTHLVMSLPEFAVAAVYLVIRLRYGFKAPNPGMAAATLGFASAAGLG